MHKVTWFRDRKKLLIMHHMSNDNDRLSCYKIMKWWSYSVARYRMKFEIELNLASSANNDSNGQQSTTVMQQVNLRKTHTRTSSYARLHACYIHYSSSLSRATSILVSTYTHNIISSTSILSYTISHSI